MKREQFNLKQAALAFADKLIELYFIDRRLDRLPACMNEKISWIGTGENELCQNLMEAKQALKAELKEYSGSFIIRQRQVYAVPFDDACIVYGMLEAEPEDKMFAIEKLRFSIVLDKELKLLHLHFSYPDMDQKAAHYYVESRDRSNLQDLKQTLVLRSRQLELLNNSLPGSAHQCRKDAHFTLITMSDSFLSMFGYTREEIANRFHNHFIEMVYPNDRSMMLSMIHKQLKKGSDIELEYRVLCKSGKPIWVLDKGRLLTERDGSETFFSLLIEITQRKQAQEALRLSLERYQVIMDQATDIIFEWDIARDTLFFSPNWYKKFGYAAISKQISQRIPVSENIHPDDMHAFMRIMKDTAAGVPYSETEFRIRDRQGKYHWCRIRATAQFDADGKAIKAVGVILDIDDEKRQHLVLLDMAQKDALTGLYNKAAIDSLVAARMQNCEASGKQALLILDVDHFKSVNDTYGHLAGDSLLASVAAVIKSQIRSSDLAGRIGGDEFLIYMASINDEENVLRKAEKLLSALEELTPLPNALPITCSIGAAVFSYGEGDYHTFFQCADQALYIRKKSGRKGVTFYQAVKECSSDHLMSAVNEESNIDQVEIMEEQLAQYAFRKLYAAKDIHLTIERLLGIIGHAYDVSRVYIFESNDGHSCFNTFEWCAKGIKPMNSSISVSLAETAQRFDEQGLFYCAEVKPMSKHYHSYLASQDCCSLLQCAILDEGEFAGYVGFDECREHRVWESKQIAAFKLTADVLSAFLMKLRLKQALKIK